MAMAIVSAAALRNELQKVEDDEMALRKELQKAQREVLEARQAGAALLTAVEAAMAPLMQELATARNACGTADLTTALDEEEDGGEKEKDATMNGLRSATAAGLEAEIRHMELDISHYQDQVEHHHAEERHHDHEMRKLTGEISEISESLSYEKQRVRHYEMKKQLGSGGEGWAGLGPSGVGRRTMEVRSEQQLREAAENRTGRLTRDLTRLALDTATQQTTIEQLNKRLGDVRKVADQRDGHLRGALTTTSELHRRIRGEPPEISERGLKKKKKGTASTGKIPHLSF